MKFLRREFFVALILSSGLLMSCVSTESRQPGNVKFPISSADTITDATRDKWVAQMGKNQALGASITGNSATELVLGKVLYGITREGERVVLEMTGPDQDLAIYRSEITADNSVIDQKQGTWWPSGDLICSNLKGGSRDNLSCHRLHQTEDHHVMVDLEGEQQFRFHVLKEVDVADIERRFAAGNTADPEEEDEEDRPHAYWIGVAVAYSELCNTFSGNGVDPRVLKSVADEYKSKDGYDKGYHRLSGVRGSDGIGGTGLIHCSNMNTLVLMTYEGLDK